jgi:hypothetical protein
MVNFGEVIWRWSLHRFSHWGNLVRSHPIRTSVGSAVAVFTALVVLFWHFIHTHIALWLSKVSHPIFQVAQDHPTAGRFIHVLINAVPDFSFALLAIAGLAYLVPGYVKKLEEERGVRIFLICFFTLFGLLAIVVNAVNREVQDHTAASQEDRMGVVLKSVTNIQDALKSKSANMTEAERREHLAASLRDEYILSHDPIDPAILAGKAMPPEAWMNSRLNQMGETWTVAKDTPQASAPRSYIVLDGNPKFTGPNAAGTEGSDFVAGSPIAFNVHFKNTGPNALETGEEAMASYLKDDYKPETQEAVVAQFTNEVRKEKKNLKGHMPDATHVHTMGSGTSEFLTAVSWSDTLERVSFTQDDLDKLKAGARIAFVIAEISYKDAGIQHHFRMCMWLQPPATANGIWHFCDGFNKSD